MASRQHSLTKAAIKRAIEAVTSTGLIVSAVKFDPDGSVRVLLGEADQTKSTASALEKWMASRAHST